MSPVEPPPTAWDLGDPTLDHPSDLWAVGGDVEPGTLLAAYRRGLFPMRLPDDGPLGWWWPAERAVIPVATRPPRTVRRASARYRVVVDSSFLDVVRACADPVRPGGWIDEDVVEAYAALHRGGWAHSVEAWDDLGLAGGLYGVAVGGLFAAESMFHRRTDASKAALAGLLALLRAAGDAERRVLDAQWLTPHLARVGAVPVTRARYRALLAAALTLADPFGGGAA